MLGPKAVFAAESLHDQETGMSTYRKKIPQKSMKKKKQRKY